jgi:hypothetical protein
VAKIIINPIIGLVYNKILIVCSLKIAVLNKDKKTKGAAFNSKATPFSRRILFKFVSILCLTES